MAKDEPRVASSSVQIDPNKGIVNTYKRADVTLDDGRRGTGYAVDSGAGSDQRAMSEAINDARSKSSTK